MSAEDYVLGRAVEDSVRLDAQHLLWRLQQGQLLHPDISLEDGQSIAEIGCGTGIWLLDLAQSVPNSIKLFGFDVSNRQFPPKEDWPENLSFGVLDSLQDVPADLLEKFDIVHVRMWASNILPSDLPLLVGNIHRMLKPGGYLQWEEADLVDQVVRSDLAHEFERNINNLFELAGLNYSWVSQLPTSLEEGNFDVLSFQRMTLKKSITQLGTNTYLLALREILSGIERRLKTASRVQQACSQSLDAMLQKTTPDLVYNWTPVCVLARKRWT